MTPYISSIASSVCRWCGISDFKAAANDLMNHRWKACAVHALTGAAKAAVIFGTLYKVYKVHSNMKASAAVHRFWNEPGQCGGSLSRKGALLSCEDFISKGFQGYRYVVPPLNAEKDFFVRMTKDCTCQVVLTRCGLDKYRIGDRKIWFTTPDNVSGMLSDGNWAEAGGGIANMFRRHIGCNGNV